MISVIIPVYNEAAGIAALLNWLKRHDPNGSTEIIVVDGGSTDDTTSMATDHGATVYTSPRKGRATQMNLGALHAKGDILYFVHADTFPPQEFISDIEKAFADGFAFGRYRTRFDSKKALLKFNAFFTRFDLFVCHGGDQTFFISRKMFEDLNGFNEEMILMEDYDITIRAKKLGRYKIIQKPALVSARKYNKNSWLSVQQANYTVVQMYKKGATQAAMANTYSVLLKH